MPSIVLSRLYRLPATVTMSLKHRVGGCSTLRDGSLKLITNLICDKKAGTYIIFLAKQHKLTIITKDKLGYEENSHIQKVILDFIHCVLYSI